MHLPLTYLRPAGHRLASCNSPHVLTTDRTRTEQCEVCIGINTVGKAGLVTVIELSTLGTVGSVALPAETLLIVTLDNIERLAVRSWTYTT